MALVLVAEDNPITRRMVRFTLESEGYEVQEAVDGQSALALAAERRPDLVIQDYVLPDMDGLELLRRLRSRPGFAAVPVLMVTGMASLIEELRDRAAGPTTVLPKPLEPSRLLEIVRGYLTGRAAHVGRGRRVLVVDDELLGRKLAALRLRDAGFEVEVAAGGEHALELVRQTRVDAILSDVMMPGVDGFSLCRTVRSDLRLGHVPVVLVSSSFADARDHELARAVGAHALLPRSPNFQEAIDALDKALASDDGAPAAAMSPADVEALHVERMRAQLERQVARNDALLRQGAIQAAALSVVRGLAQVLADPRDIAGMLGDVLVHCLDAAGLSTGILYLPGSDGKLRLHAVAGLPSASREGAARFFDHPEAIEAVLASGEPVACSITGATPDPALRAFGAGLARSSCLVVPFVVAGRRLGALVIASDSQDLTEPGWRGFASALGSQFGQTIAVGRSMALGAESEARYRTLLEHANDAILLLDAEQVVVQANRRAMELLGREVVGERWTDVLPGVPSGSGSTGRLEGIPIPRPDGSTVMVDVSTAVVEMGSESLALAILHDVTERHHAATEMRRARGRLEHVLASSPAVLYTLQVSGTSFTATWVSSNLERATGYAASTALREGWWETNVHPEDHARVMQQGEEILEAGEVRRTYRFRQPDGSYRWIRDQQRLVRDERGEPVEIVGAWWDVEELKRTEMLREQEAAQYRLLFDNNPHPMWVYDAQTLAFLAVNDAALRSYGFSREEFLAMNIMDIRPPEAREELRQRLRAGIGGSGTAGVFTHWNKAHQTRRVEVVSSPITFESRAARLVLATDVTERVALETQLRQAQKMEAVGRLAGGVAHDFNNLLGVICGYGEMVQRGLTDKHPLAPKVTQIMKAADRATGLTRQLLAFSRKQVLEPKVLDLNGVVVEMAGILRRLIGEDVELSTLLAPDLARIKADPGELGQVVMNLAVNARDAMPSGGQLVIETRDVVVDEATARTWGDGRPGPYVRLSVTDSGEGIPPEVMGRLFEPFFTTKPAGKGTGLGLATVFGIVKQSGGHIDVSSTPGAGTTFTIHLPAVEAAVSEPLPPDVAPAPSAAHETVLLVEDSESLREMTGEILRDAGYRVVSAATAAEAIALAEGTAMDVVLTDVVLPGMDGPSMVAHLRRIRPGVRVVFMSGYAGHGSLDAILENGHATFLPKPFVAAALLGKLREALTEPSGEPA